MTIRSISIYENFRIGLCELIKDADYQAIKDFSDWILSLGDGRIADDNDGEANVEISTCFIVNNSHDPIKDIV